MGRVFLKFLPHSRLPAALRRKTTATSCPATSSCNRSSETGGIKSNAFVFKQTRIPGPRRHNNLQPFGSTEAQGEPVWFFVSAMDAIANEKKKSGRIMIFSFSREAKEESPPPSFGRKKRPGKSFEMPGRPLGWFADTSPSGSGLVENSSFFRKIRELARFLVDFRRYSGGFRGVIKTAENRKFFESGRILTERRHDSPNSEGLDPNHRPGGAPLHVPRWHVPVKTNRPLNHPASGRKRLIRLIISLARQRGIIILTK